MPSDAVPVRTDRPDVARRPCYAAAAVVAVEEVVVHRRVHHRSASAGRPAVVVAGPCSARAAEDRIADGTDTASTDDRAAGPDGQRIAAHNRVTWVVRQRRETSRMVDEPAIRDGQPLL